MRPYTSPCTSEKHSWHCCCCCCYYCSGRKCSLRLWRCKAVSAMLVRVTREAEFLTVRNHGLFRKWDSIVAVSFVGSGGGLLSTGAISKDTGEYSSRCTVGTNIVDLWAFAVVVIVVLVLVQGTAFRKLIHVDLVLLVAVLSTVSKTCN